MRIISRIPGFRRRPPTVSVVRLSGIIGGAAMVRRGLVHQSLAPVLEKAFSGRRTVAVALAINSPGGSPVQSDLIAAHIITLSRERDIPVFAFCEDVAASGGYWLALSAGEIYANQSTIVGSIGVVTAGFGLDRLIERFGIERRVYTTGPKKGMLDPFRPADPDHVEHLRGVHAVLFERFRAFVAERRGHRLAAPEDELYSGAFWSGSQALEYGLIDGFGSLRSVMRERFGTKVRFRQFGMRRGVLGRLQRATGWSDPDGAADRTWADELLAAVETRTMWGRFGL